MSIFLIVQLFQLFSLFPFMSWIRGKKWQGEVDFSAEQAADPGAARGSGVPMRTIPLDINGHYEYKVRLACGDYTWRAKLLLLMMMCICFSEGWIASNGFCFQFLCSVWGTSGSWVLILNSIPLFRCLWCIIPGFSPLIYALLFLLFLFFGVSGLGFFGFVFWLFFFCSSTVKTSIIFSHVWLASYITYVNYERWQHIEGAVGK